MVNPRLIQHLVLHLLEFFKPQRISFLSRVNGPLILGSGLVLLQFLLLHVP